MKKCCYFATLCCVLSSLTVVFAADKDKLICKKIQYYSAAERKHVESRKCFRSKFTQKSFLRVAKISRKLDQIRPAKHSLLSRRYDRIKAMMLLYKGLSFYKPNYLIPYYYSFNKTDWYRKHPGNTPNDEAINNAEFKQQISFIYPLWMNIGETGVTLNFGYTQLMYWQVYNNSAFFRETNYSPSLFFSLHPAQNWLFTIGMRHQSNGRGGLPPDGMERSWNRFFADIAFSGKDWMVMLEPWYPVSDDKYNPDIARYLGYGQCVFVYQKHSQTVSIMLRNMLESGFSRGAIEVDYSFPVSKRVNGFLQVFSGYGQSLIEYNHRTSSVGIGIAFSNWV